jgi:HD-GYP domain-containing protein (c-di-GMP phosphodiesterase class II)
MNQSKYTILDNLLEGCQIIDFDWRYAYLNDTVLLHARKSRGELLGRTMMEAYPGIDETQMFALLRRCMQDRIAGQIENEFTYPDGAKGWFLLRINPVTEGLFILSVDITDRKWAELRVRYLARLYATLSQVNQTTVRVREPDELFRNICRVAVEHGKFGLAWIGLFDPDSGLVTPVASQGLAQDQLPFQAINIGAEPFKSGLIGAALHTGRVGYGRDIQSDPSMAHWHKMAVAGGFYSAAAVPFRRGGQVIGTLNLYATDVDIFAVEEEQRLLEEMGMDISFALDTMELETRRKQSEEKIERQIRHLNALRTIDVAIAHSHDVKLTAEIIVQQSAAELGADAVGLLLLNPHTFALEPLSNYGFLSQALKTGQVRLGKGFSGRVALERKVLHVPDMRETRIEFTAAPLLDEEGFVAYVGAPLLAKGQVKGVLEVFHRRPFEPAPEWFEFLDMLAGQAAIALDSAQAYEDLHQTNLELSLAYDATIEGWSRAMDLRDHETEGHTQRVTRVTVLLAREMGMKAEDLVHLRRGALLHDIGKLGVPDRILLKPGPLDEQEWAIMRQHPQLAFEMLLPIVYLRPALDIPYCHHEKWDGTGYPRGLKGTQIPLAARLFAVVDVWDALRSDRPYRQAWPDDQVLEHIKALSGSHFDPQVVELFLRLLDEMKTSDMLTGG